jgi:hypothetical protein
MIDCLNKLSSLPSPYFISLILPVDDTTDDDDDDDDEDIPIGEGECMIIVLLLFG